MFQSRQVLDYEYDASFLHFAQSLILLDHGSKLIFAKKAIKTRLFFTGFTGPTPYWTWPPLCYFVSSYWAGWPDGWLFIGTTYPFYSSLSDPWALLLLLAWTLFFFIESLLVTTLAQRKNLREMRLMMAAMTPKWLKKRQPLKLSSPIVRHNRPLFIGASKRILYPKMLIESLKEPYDWLSRIRTMYSIFCCDLFPRGPSPYII